jgi:hypothetical protein
MMMMMGDNMHEDDGRKVGLAWLVGGDMTRECCLLGAMPYAMGERL